MEEAKEITKGGKTFRIKIIHDENPESPREWDNLGTMVCFHGRYNLGDKHEYNSDHYNRWDDMEKEIIKRENVCVILPLYLYDHSGITMNTTGFSCPWDSGQVGYVFVSKEKVRKEYGVKRITKKVIEQVTNVLVGEVSTYDQYLTGDVYGYEIYEVTTNNGIETETFVDSCWGFYGSDHCMEEAESIVV